MFRTACFSGNLKLALKGQLHEILLPLIFFLMNPDRISGLKIWWKLQKWSSQVADIRKNCDCRIAELRLQSNISLKSCGIAIAELLPSSCVALRLRTQKKVARAHLCYLVELIIYLTNSSVKRYECRQLKKVFKKYIIWLPGFDPWSYWNSFKKYINNNG